MFAPGPVFRAMPAGSNSFQMSWIREAIAEFIGTFFITFVPTLTLSAAFTSQRLANGTFASLTTGFGFPIANALVFMLTLICIVGALGHVSGAHVNPAVTIAMVVIREISFLKALLYIVAQFLGGLLASLTVYGIVGDKGYEAGLGGNGAFTGYGDGEVLFAELIITFFFVMTIVGVALDSQRTLNYATGVNSPLAIGAALGAGHFALSFIDGASMNPARSLGPWIVSENFNRSWWAILIGPILGAILGALAYLVLFFDTSDSKPASAFQATSSYSSDSYYDF